ncbi:type IV pilus modification PilV family protein [Agromyces protaetiae]|uniref:type IV pilus modification PilV family protein n=1 Tax=Agromyces protaetiae TaxID=2509455 RepID=UPI0013EA5110|nr:prepilin-type N-terminal cleavage/methylation domain-containing protein [Agromyces protaetiae]
MSARARRGIASVAARLRREEAGLTLVELLVAVILMGIILTIVASLFVTTTRSTAQSGEVHEATGNVSNMANAMNGVIRFATTNPKSGSTIPDPAIVEARANELVLMAVVQVSATVEPQGRPPRPTLVEYSIVGAGRELQERRWNPTGSNSNWVFGGSDPTTQTPASIRSLGGRLSTGGAVFTYFDINGALLNPGTGQLDATNRAKVAAIGIRLSVVPPDEPTANPVVIERRIPLTNLGLREPS